MAKSLFRLFCEDARFYRRIKRPDKPDSGVGTIVTALASKGWWMLVFHRIIYNSTSRRNLRSIAWWFTRILEIPASYLNAVLNKSELLGDCEIPDAVYLSDRGYLMFGAKYVGAGTVIHDHVTVGYAVAQGRGDRPSIGKNVWIGPNCIIAGGVHIGDGATLLPGTVLTHSVPPGSLVKGNPSRIIKKEFDNASFRRTAEVVDKNFAQAP